MTTRTNTNVPKNPSSTPPSLSVPIGRYNKSLKTNDPNSSSHVFEHVLGPDTKGVGGKESASTIARNFR